MIKLIGEKKSQSQSFLEDGTRIPVTQVYLPSNLVVSIKSQEKDKYWAVQLGLGTKKKANRSLLGHAKKANLQTAPKVLREVRLIDNELENMPKVGDTLRPSDVFKPGDIVDVIGISKGKGFAGVVKRHHFKGGPRTHGQSDRERAPGSIGQTTTPGRVYKGKRMAGRMGHEKVTIKNLLVLDVIDEGLLIKGLVPGARNGLLMIEKVGQAKNFIPLYVDKKTEAKEGGPTSSA